MLYRVTYEIDVEATTPKKAALEVEQVLKGMKYRPYLKVTSALFRCKSYEFDLEKEEVEND